MKRSQKKATVKKDRNKEKAKHRANKNLDYLITEMGLASIDWDYLIVSDGSGTQLDKPCGWCGVLLHNSATFERKFFHGGMNTGTNVMAEMMGFIHPLMWLSRQKSRTKPALVHVLTDCEVAKNTGNNRSSRKANRALWHFFGALERELGNVTFHWMPRESTMLNRYADRVAGYTRKLLLDSPEKTVVEMLGLADAESIHDLNSS